MKLKKHNIIVSLCAFCVFLFMSACALNRAQASSGLPLDNGSTIELTAEEKAWLAEGHEVRVRVGNWPPFMMINGKARGIAIDYLEEIFRHHNIRYRYVSGTEISWQDALEAIKNHQFVDMVPTVKVTSERARYMLFSEEYLFLPWVIFTRADSPFVGSINDLKGKTVSVPEGYVMQELLAKHYPEIGQRVFFGNKAVSRCLESLALGEVDAYIGNLAVGSYLIQQEGYTNVKVASPTPFGSHDNAMGMRDDWPELVGIINKTLAAFTPEQKATIWNRWLSVRYEHGLKKTDIVRWGLGAAFFVTAIILGVLLWNNRLIKEIGRRKQTEKRLRESELKFKMLTKAAFEGLVIAKEGLVLEVNEVMARMFGYCPTEMVGKEITEFVVSEEQKKVRQRTLAEDEGAYEVVCLRKDGSSFPAEVHARMFDFQDQRVRVWALRDISVRKQAEEERGRFIAELKKLATIDDLTGIYNRQAFFTRLDEEVERCERYGHNFCLAILDIDRFKKINDRYGHPGGDVVLKTFAAKISASIRTNDIFARIGGEEFALLLPEATLQSATMMLEKLRQAIEQADIALADGQRVRITFSCGVATSTEAGFNIAYLVKRADQRLYLAKSSGRNQVVSRS